MFVRAHPVAWLTLALSAACPAQAAGPEIFARSVISLPVSVAAPAFTPDGRTVYFHRKEGEQRTIYVSSKIGEIWSAPVVASFAEQWINIEPAIAPDGSYMIFASNRPVERNGKVLDGNWGNKAEPGRGGNLWRMDRAGSGWSPPRRLPAEINQGSSVFAPAVSGDGTLLFMKPGVDGRFHLFEAYPRGSGYDVQPLPFSNDGDGISDYDPAIGKDGSYLLFCSTRDQAQGSAIYIAFRKADGAWSTPQRLPEALNSASDVTELRLSPDETRIYFAHDNSIWSEPLEAARDQLRFGARAIVGAAHIHLSDGRLSAAGALGTASAHQRKMNSTRAAPQFRAS